MTGREREAIPSSHINHAAQSHHTNGPGKRIDRCDNQPAGLQDERVGSGAGADIQNPAFSPAQGESFPLLEAVLLSQEHTRVDQLLVSDVTPDNQGGRVAAVGSLERSLEGAPSRLAHRHTRAKEEGRPGRPPLFTSNRFVTDQSPDCPPMFSHGLRWK